VNNQGYSITSISYRNCGSKEISSAIGAGGSAGTNSGTSALLVNAMPNYLLLYKLQNNDISLVSLRLRKRICIKQNEENIRSTFCPNLLKKPQSSSPNININSCLVCTGSEDGCVYLYDMENDERPLINKLHGHSSPVRDVSLNFDQSLLASGDNQVSKRSQIDYILNQSNNKKIIMLKFVFFNCVIYSSR
jgi:WD40 repeat protein